MGLVVDAHWVHSRVRTDIRSGEVTMRGLLIPGDWKEVAYVPWKGTFEEIQQMFNCSTVELIKTPIRNLVMMVDEDGRLKDMQPNHKAMLFYPGVIVGPAMLSYVDNFNHPDMKFTGIPEGFDFHMVGESSYQRIVARFGEHPTVSLQEPTNKTRTS